MTNSLPNIARANRLLRAAWDRGLLTEPVMDPNAIERAALRGLDPGALGEDDGWRERFERLVEALREEADLNPLGLTMAHSQIASLLRARVRLAALSPERRAGVEDRPAPIIIAGQMRSGTTRMQRLLACDPRFAVTRAYETLTPLPQAGRRVRALAILTALQMLNPETRRIHPVGPDDPEEEYGWLAFGFSPAQFEAQWRIPSFSRWSEQCDARPIYRDFDRLLRLNAAARGGEASKRWVLKAPQYMEDLGPLLDQFPSSTVVLLDRERSAVVASSASLVWNQVRIQSDRVDRSWIGQEWVRKTNLRDERAARALADRPGVAVVRIDFEAMNRDWLGEMRRVYETLGLELTPVVIDRMAQWLRTSKGHVGHRYRLEDFGLSKADAAVPHRAMPVRREP